MKTISLPRNVRIVLIVQLILLLSNVNAQIWFLPPIFGPPRRTPSPSVPPPSPTTANRPAGLRAGFYLGLCRDKTVNIEAIIKAEVQEQFSKDRSILPAFVRMQFHDCFVHGCDASILIKGPSSERNADANRSVRGYEFIDTLKEIAEAQCPGIVSCADLIAIVTAEVLRLGGGPAYAVQTGRCDGLVSNADDVNLPGPDITAGQSINIFGAKNFSPEEMVVLLGTHTIGVAHCEFFQNRLYPGTPQFDPFMDPNLRSSLTSLCPQGQTSTKSTFLDQNPTSSNLVDNSYYTQIRNNRGILGIDQALARDLSTASIVQALAQDQTSFNNKLANAMLKLQALEVKTGNQGEIRRTCSSFNGRT